ncbi:hypothetical protein FH972_025915 [Carpinus fangiana]|uniref:Disease resistance R13L4/SHOC-2-like LRR domain-containing protein n=1 Tax=Carpinus fangiana TaxID=176857 RepID=A0A5N6L2E1_9ROSI|nr:hypothetical protein FH972_025915 [Carpinus fangiana]
MADDDTADSPRKGDALTIAREAIELHHETIQREHEGQHLPAPLFGSCCVDLSSLKLTSLPDELIDIIRNEVNVLRLDRNLLATLSSLGPRLPEFSRLRYLSLRHNRITEFPRELLDLANLEVLDLKDNLLTALPEDLSRLSRIKKLTIKENKVTSLPTCIGSMHSLSMLSATDNPITFPPPDKWLIDSPKSKGESSTANSDVQATIRLKKFMLEHVKGERLRVETDSERQSESNTETTPKPAKRQTSGRFPIRPSTSSIDISAMAGPGSPRMPVKPPSLPLSKHVRVPTGPRSAALRPSIAPLASNNSERNRSNSESQTFTTIRERRRGVIHPKSGSDQARLDTQKLNRLSHARGISFPSNLQNGVSAYGVTDDSSPPSPVDTEPARGAFVSRLSSLPEKKRKSQFYDPRVELAHGVDFVLCQLRFPLHYIKENIKDGASRRPLFERAYHGVYAHLDELRRRLQSAEIDSEDAEEGEAPDALERIYDSCQKCLRGFEQFLETLQQQVALVVQQANAAYVRSLMLLLYGGLVELRNANSKVLPDTHRQEHFALSNEFNQLRAGSPHYSPKHSHTVSRNFSMDDPNADRPLTSLRVRDKTTKSNPRRSPNMRPKPLALHGRGPSGSLASLNGYPSRGYEAYNGNPISEPPGLSRSNTLASTSVDFDDPREEQVFQDIWNKLMIACDTTARALPTCEMQLNHSRRSRRGLNNHEAGILDDVSAKCSLTLHSASALRGRLHSMRHSRSRESPEFWQLCLSLTSAQAAFVQALKKSIHAGLVPSAVKSGVRPVHDSIKAAGSAISASCWRQYTSAPSRKPSAVAVADPTFPTGLVSPPPTAPLKQQYPIPMNTAMVPAPSLNLAPGPALVNTGSPTSSNTVKSPPTLGLNTKGYVSPPNPNDPQSAVSSVNSGMTSGSVTPLPATPLTASLGPAAAATVPTVVGKQLPLHPGAVNNGPVVQSIVGHGNVTGATNGNSSINGVGMSTPNLQGMLVNHANGEGTVRAVQRSASMSRRPGPI